MPLLIGLNATDILFVKFTLYSPVPKSVRLEQLNETRKNGVDVPSKHAWAFAALCPVSVAGPVPAALLIVVALISDNGQVPVYSECHA